MSRDPRLPAWLTKPLGDPASISEVRAILAAHRLNTVCDEAKCPNRAECFGRGTATFMILGDRCTRNCGFCSVSGATPIETDPSEPYSVAAAAGDLSLEFVVVTSVTRDDLPDGGASHFARTVAAIRSALPRAGVEVLVPDFGGDRDAVDTVLAAGPDVFGHNVETVARLYPVARAEADYRRSLDVLAHAASSGRARVKSAIMLGLGETETEIETTLRDLAAAGVEIVYLGQYLRPSSSHLPVERFVPPEEFEAWEARCEGIGFAWTSAAPFVRSSYEADRAFARLGERSGDQRGECA